MDLSVVIPAYNEQDRIAAPLRRIADHFDRIGGTWEMVVVNDGSKDGTSQVLREAAKTCPNLRVLTMENNRGKGRAVREGVLASTGELILVTDADLATPIEEFGQLKTVLDGKGCDGAIGVRRSGTAGSSVERPFLRGLSGRVFNFFVQLFLLPGCEDSQCGFKLFKRDVARQLFSRQKLDGFGFDMEVLFLARRLGYRIESVPVSSCDQPGSKVRVWKDGMRMLLDIFKIKKIHRMP